jgi:hypothetical protein
MKKLFTPENTEKDLVEALDFIELQARAFLTSTCHVERPVAITGCPFSLSDSILNGVETSLYSYRCFDSVYGDLTALSINVKHGAWVAQHDKSRENVMELQNISSFSGVNDGY